MSLEIYAKPEVDALLEPLWAMIRELQERLQQVTKARVVWIDQEEAEQLTGRSSGWFYQNRTRGTLPIAMLPRAEGSKRLKYSQQDCIDYGIKRMILPPDYTK